MRRIEVERAHAGAIQPEMLALVRRRWRRVIDLVAATVLSLIVVLMFADAAEAATSASLSSASVTRAAATGNLVWDATATSSGIWSSSGTTACWYGSSCTATLQARLVSGSTVDLQTDSVSQPGSGGGSYSHRFTGDYLVAKINALRVTITGGGSTAVGAWKTVTDPYPVKTLTITAASVTRSSSNGYLNYDVTTSATGFSMPDGQCQGSYCAETLELKRTDGSVVQVDSVDGIYGAPYPLSEHFMGQANTIKVSSIRAVIYSQQSGVPDLASAWKSVSDPYPTPSLTITSKALSRRATDGYLVYSVTTSAQGYSVPDAQCPGVQTQFCTEYLEVRYLDGSSQMIDASGDHLPSDGWPYVYTYSGFSAIKQINAIRAVIYPQSNSVSPLTSGWITVTDPYPPTTFTVTSANLGRDRDNNVTFDVTTSATGYWLPDSQCGNSASECDERVIIGYKNGDFDSVPIEHIEGKPYPYVAHISGSSRQVPDGSGGYSPVTSLQVSISASMPAGPDLIRSLMITSLPSRTEFRGGANAAESACPCSHGDPVDSLSGALTESSTDLLLPGAGPAVSVDRTYSSQGASADGPFGYGWASGVSAHLEFPVTDTVDVVQENGATVEFAKQSNGSYVPPARVLATLAFSSTSNTWTYVRRGTDTFRFDSGGQLTQLRDPHGTAVTVTRDASSGYATKLTGVGGRWISYTWDPSGSGHITAASDSAGRTVHYSYGANGDLTSVVAADGATTVYAYDNDHQLTSLTRPGGGVTSNVYDDSGRVITQTDPLGKVTHFAYGAFATTVTDPTGTKTTETYNGGLLVQKVQDVDGAHPRTSTFAYDTANNLVSATNGRGKTTTYTYDTRGNVITKTDPLNHTTTYTYNALNEVLTATDARGKTSTTTYNTVGDRLTATSRAGVQQSWTYNSNGTPATWVDGRGKTTSYGYNPTGLQTTATDPDARTTTTGYNAAGFVTSHKDAANQTTSYTRDALGRLLTATTPGQHVTTYTYDADGNVATVSDPRGKVTTNHYDAAGQLTSVDDPLGHTTQTSYDDDGRVATTTDAAGHITTKAYDAFGELTAVTDPNGHVTHYGYDDDGNRTSTTLPSGAQSTATYDDADQLASTTDARGKTTTIGRDANGQITSTTDPLNRTTSQSWTDDGLLASTTLPDASTTSRSYTATGALASYTNPDGAVTTYAYDDAGLPTGKTEPGGLTTSYAYDSAGRLKTTTTPDGHIVTLGYDADGNVTSSHSDVSGSTDVGYTYNANGQRLTMQDATGTSQYSYDAAGQLTSTTNGAGTTVGYGYTATGDLASITYPGSKTVAYAYDSAGQMTGLTDWQNRTTNFTWTANGLLHDQTTPNGVTQTWTHDADGETTDIAVANSGTIADYGYTYDDAGQLVGDSSTDPLGSNITHTYSYDPLSQLAGVQGAGPTGSVTASPGGKLTKTSDGTTYGYNAAQQLTSSTPTTGSSTTYAFDGNGARLASTIAAAGTSPAATTTYGYDRDGNLSSVALPSGATISYASDGDGLRQSRTASSATRAFTWDTLASLPLLLDDGDHSYLYGPNDTPVAQVDDSTGTVQYLHGDLVGSTRVITDASGAPSGSYRFGSYGAVLAHTGATSTIGYTGNWTDPATGLVYLRARDFDPMTGQFVQVDPAVDATHQPYAYVANDPLASVDPTGLCWEWQTWADCQSQLATHVPSASESLRQLGSIGTQLVQTFDPVYYGLPYFDKAIQQANSGCYLGSLISGARGAAVTAGAFATFGVGSEMFGARAAGVASAEDGAAAAARVPTVEIDEANAAHMFRSARGHVEDTPANRELIISTVSPGNIRSTQVLANYNGTLSRYARLLPDGRQAWAEVRNGKITNGGINDDPR